MKGFVPEDFITFEIEEGKSMLLQEKILHTTPSKVRGSYYVVGGTGDDTMVSVAVLNENMRVIFKHQKDIQGIMYFDNIPVED